MLQPPPPPEQIWFERYQPVRRQAEVAFWVFVLVLQAVANTVVVSLDLARVGRPLPWWQPALWEVSSNLAIGLLLPAVVAFERRHPLRWGTLRSALPRHFAASVMFCAFHVLLMFGMRQAAYALVGETYILGAMPQVLFYEYLKDVRTYVLILAALVSYRLVMLRLQGEARVLDAAPEPAGEAPAGIPSPTAGPAEPARPERFLVRQLRKEFLIAAADIEWLQAQGNYVALNVNGHVYLLRSTLADFMEKLDPAKFARIHRSHAVHLDRVAEIEPLEGGDARIRMKSGALVPCSRRYRGALDPSAPPRNVQPAPSDSR
ncbi:LytTR family DNA-binding domain-containing protein [Variovorax sp. VNK109]|uniref:LytTR family DNA-binding domain-containing protein n=1 Tax=Variovorax sp. VNK109 TaxID=3400919 RepID=UPI003BFF3D61